MADLCRTIDLKARIAELNVLIAQQEEEVKKEQAAQAVGGPTGSEDWSFNDRGEVSLHCVGLARIVFADALPCL